MERIALFWFLLLVSCQPKKDFNPQAVALQSECPAQSTCEIRIIPGKSLRITQAESTTYTLEDNPSKNVILYKHHKIVKGDLADAGYREELVFEIDKSVTSLRLQDMQLQETKMLFGRFCFCKGQTGYYPVTKGTLSIDAAHNGMLGFTASGIPQVTQSIRFSLQ